MLVGIAAPNPIALRIGIHYVGVMRLSLGSLCLASCLSLGCGDSSGAGDVGSDATRDAAIDAASDAAADVPSTDAVVDALVDTLPDPPSAEVSHPREVRGTWIATVSRINWPRGDGPAAQQAELVRILDAAKSAGLNTVFFQVRPEADALYESSLEPWSRYLTGTQGADPGYDPLQFAIDEAHARGLELHAWLNPYRARAGTGATSADHVSHTMPDAVLSYGSFLWLDPGNPTAFDHTLAVVRDIVSRYDVDGIHFDDYFYPYPEAGERFDDDATFALHGGGLTLADWRRDNVNRMVQRVGEVVAEARADVRFGISPFGIYRPGMPEGVVGLDQYTSLYADVLAWMRGGWLDYVAPQLYWPTTSTGQSYGDLLDWWADRASETGRTLLVGNSASQRYGIAEYRAEMDVMRAARDRNAHGAIWWSVGPIVANEDGLSDMLASEYYASPAASPALVDVASTTPVLPVGIVEEDGAIRVERTPGIRYWAAYQSDEPEGDWTIERLFPADRTRLTLPAGRWAISAINRSGFESRGLIVETTGADEPEPPGATCVHSLGGVYVDGGCSPSFQCCDGSWLGRGVCGACTCVEDTGVEGCGTMGGS